MMNAKTFRLLATIFATMLAFGAATVACAATTAAATQGAGPSITGFRAAQFGMTQSQVRGAIESGFGVSASVITASTNPLQHTAVLTVQVPDLVPGGGTASLSYVFGYQSHRLIEISALWSKAIDPKITPTMLYQNGESLQQYFASEGFPAERSTGNMATPQGVLLFRATDQAGNAVLLILSGTMSKDPKSPDKSILTPIALNLAYAADPQHPDVFQLAKGSF